MNFIDEQHVARFEVGQERGEIAGPGEHRARSGAKADAKLARDDLRERRLAKTRAADKQHVVERFAARAAWTKTEKFAFAWGWPTNSERRLGTQRGVADIVAAALGRDDAGGGGHATT